MIALTLHIALVVGCFLSLSGCAIQYYDKDSGVEHLWGLGHLQMKAQQSDTGSSSVVYGGETIGFSAGTTAAGGHVAIGWREERRIFVSPNGASVRFEWPSSEFFKVRIGSGYPRATDE